MKKSILYTLLAVVFLAGCTKHDGPVPDGVNLERIPEPQIVKNGGSAAIDVLDLAAFEGKFDVSLFFPEDVPPSKMDIVVMKNSDKSTVKMFQADVTSFPASFTVTAAQLADLFGEPVELGDDYDFGADVYTQDGKKYQAFPATGVAYGSSIAGQPGASTGVRYSAICAYDPSIYEGAFVVVEDEFADLAPGDVVVLTKIDDTHFSYVYPSGINPTPIIVTVNPADNSLSITKQKFGTAFTWQPAYTNPNAETKPNPLNFVAPCDKEWGAVVNYTVDQGSFGGYYLKMKKQ